MHYTENLFISGKNVQCWDKCIPWYGPRCVLKVKYKVVCLIASVALQTSFIFSWIFWAHDGQNIHFTSSFLYSDGYVFYQDSDLRHIIFRVSSFSRILAGNSVIYCGSDWGTFGRSSNSKLCQSTSSFFFCVCFFTPTPSPSISLTHSPLISTYLCPTRWRCEIFKRTLLFGDNALQQMGHRRTDPNVCKSPYKAAQDVFNITQVPQALF